jgi:drug/metabolite transporter (DMT)-like permease
MKAKLLIFVGILFLTVGIMFRAFDISQVVGLLLIVLGAVMKSTYIIIKLYSKEYKPGVELVLLLAGLFLFFYFRYSDHPFSEIFMGLGIVLKVSFVILFIRKMRGRR